MKTKKLYVIIISVFLLTLCFCGIVKSEIEEIINVYNIEYGGLKIDITAPVKAYPGENINITVISETITQIYIEYIYIKIYGLVNATTEIALADITHVEGSSENNHEAKYNITIPDNISPGLTYGMINCEWDFMGAPQKIPSSGFVMTYINNVALETLQADFEELSTVHQAIVQNYTELESEYDQEVGSTRNLVYVFVATTVVAAITVFVLLMRKPKKVWI
jgi:hypothetical protein